MMGGALRQAGSSPPARCGRSTTTSSGWRWTTTTRARWRAVSRDPGITIDPNEVATNIVIFQVADARALCTQLAASGVIMGALDARTVARSRTSTSAPRTSRPRSTSWRDARDRLTFRCRPTGQTQETCAS
jgi:hypothetical protein